MSSSGTFSAPRCLNGWLLKVRVCLADQAVNHPLQHGVVTDVLWLQPRKLCDREQMARYRKRPVFVSNGNV